MFGSVGEPVVHNPFWLGSEEKVTRVMTEQIFAENTTRRAGAGENGKSW